MKEDKVVQSKMTLY